MKERPILFTAPMVRAILEGRKTQTRRHVKPATVEGIETACCPSSQDYATTEDIGLAYDRPQIEDKNGHFRALKHSEWLVYSAEYPDDGSIRIGQGFGAVGDRLWVRETWARVGSVDPGFLLFRATWQEDAKRQRLENVENAPQWKPAIHLQRVHARILLEITAVRIERLQDLSEADAIAEGVQKIGNRYEVDSVVATPISAAAAFMATWEHIHGAGAWYANPLVWVLEFRRL